MEAVGRVVYYKNDGGFSSHDDICKMEDIICMNNGFDRAVITNIIKLPI